jgi:hypothetical protein
MGGDGRALNLGDKVKCNGYPAGGRGVIIEHISADSMRVMWKDSPEPTVHRARTLRRIGFRWPLSR